MYRALPPATERWFKTRMRLKALRLQARALWKGRELRRMKRGRWGRGDILLFSTVRNEAVRLPWFLDHYRRLGVGHFLFIDNASDDGTRELLLDQGDVSLWHTGASYKRSRFGQDWITALMLRHGVGRWCVQVDADELLVYPHWQTRPLPALTEWLDRSGQRSFAAMLLELYPKGALGAQAYVPGTDPLTLLRWFDAGNHVLRHNPLLDCLLMQGGVRARNFFGTTPNRAPTLTKLPLVKWGRDSVWVNSTHSALPRALNRVYATYGGICTSGGLLHTKFLPLVVERSAVEKARGQHFGNAPVFADYYDAVMAAPDLWCAASTRYHGWRQLERLGLISRGGWV